MWPEVHRMSCRHRQVALSVVAIASFVVAGLALAQDHLDDVALRDRVMRILAEVPLIDGHNDTPGQIRRRSNGHFDGPAAFDFLDTTDLTPPMHSDLTRLKSGGVGGQFWSVFIPIARHGGSEGDVRIVIEQMDLVRRMVAKYPDHLELAYTADDIVRIHAAGRIASLMGMEGGHSIENSLAALRVLYHAGARYMSLTHGKSLLWADSATASPDEPKRGGLTEFGKEVVREMNRLGMLVCLAHVAPDTMHDALDVTEAPVIFSHSSAYAVCAHARNVPDDVLLRLPDNGGVVMVCFLVSYVSEDVRLHVEAERTAMDRLRSLYPDPNDQPKIEEGIALWRRENPAPRATLGQVADHIDHIRRVAGIDHIGIGSDYDGMPPGPVGLEDVSTYPALFVELLKRGYGDDEVRKIAGLNVLRVMRAVEAAATRIQSQRGPSEALIEELDAANTAPSAVGD
jgi:membrane dipeptidase